jgi:hypothetical protein
LFQSQSKTPKKLTLKANPSCFAKIKRVGVQDRFLLKFKHATFHGWLVA